MAERPHESFPSLTTIRLSSLHGEVWKHLSGILRVQTPPLIFTPIILVYSFGAEAYSGWHSIRMVTTYHPSRCGYKSGIQVKR